MIGDIFGSILKNILNMWNIAGFCMLQQPSYHAVIYRGSIPVRNNTKVLIFKIPFFEKVLFIPKGKIIANPKSIQVGNKFLPIIKSYDISVVFEISDIVVFAKKYCCLSNDDNKISSMYLEDIVSIEMKGLLFKNIKKFKNIDSIKNLTFCNSVMIHDVSILSSTTALQISNINANDYNGK